MIYSKIETRYITATNDDRLVRYERIDIRNDTYVVKVWDDQQRGISPPSSIVEIATLTFTKDQYLEEYGMTGFPKTVRNEPPPSFEDYVWKKCQEHRNSLQ